MSLKNLKKTTSISLETPTFGNLLGWIDDHFSNRADEREQRCQLIVGHARRYVGHLHHTSVPYAHGHFEDWAPIGCLIGSRFRAKGFFGSTKAEKRQAPKNNNKQYHSEGRMHSGVSIPFLLVACHFVYIPFVCCGCCDDLLMFSRFFPSSFSFS